MSDEALPCPFCGVPATVRWRTESSVFVECTNRECEVQPMANVGSEAASLRAWNRRIPSVSTAELEKLEAELSDGNHYRGQSDYAQGRQDANNETADKLRALISKATNGRGK